MLTGRQVNEEETMVVASMSTSASRGADVVSSVRSLAGTSLLLDESPPPPPPPLTQHSLPQPGIDPLPRITEVTFGILFGGWSTTQAIEISAPFLGPWVTLGRSIEVKGFVRSPLQTTFAIAVASILVIKWERYLAPIRRRWVRRNMAPELPISTSRPAKSRLNRWLRQIMMVLLLSVTSTGFLWVLLYSLLTLSPKPTLVIRVQVVFFIKTYMVLGSLLWDLIDAPGSGQGQDQAGTAEAPGTV
jgi:hypothetical protein